MLLGENWCWSLLGPKGLKTKGGINTALSYKKKKKKEEKNIFIVKLPNVQRTFPVLNVTDTFLTILILTVL